MMRRSFRFAAVALVVAVAAFSAHGQSITSAPAPSENLTRLQERVDELEGLLQRATAESERLSIELRRSKADTLRLQRLLDDALAGQQAAPVPGAALLPPPMVPAPRATNSNVTPPASAAGSLGTLPASAAPGEAAQAFREARRLLDATRWPEAELALTAFLRDHPGSADAPEARYFLGRTQIVLGRHGDAAATFVDFLRKSPSSPRAADAWVRLGMSMKGMGQTPQACAAFRDLPVKYPAASAAVRQLAVSEARAAQCPRADVRLKFKEISMRLAAIILAVLLVAAPAVAQVVTDEALGRAPPVRAAQVGLITSTNANGMVAALQRAGFTGEVNTQGREASVIGRVGTIPFQVFLGNCDPSGGGCTEVELYAGFTGVSSLTLERVNGWNNRARFARASLDPDGSASLQMDLGLRGGVSPDNLKQNLETWGAALETYAAFLRTPAEVAPRPPGQPKTGAPKAGAPKAGAQRPK